MKHKTVLPLLRSLLAKVGSIDGAENIPDHGPFILASNHVSYLEPALLSFLAVERTQSSIYSIAKKPIWKLFRMLGLADWMGLVPVDPEDKNKCIDLCVEKLNAGFPVLIFPEGHRNYAEELQRGKTGVARLALRTGVPVIPIGYIGPKGGSATGTLGHLFKRGKQIHIHVGKPLTFSKMEQLTPERLHSTTDEIMRSIAQLSQKAYPYS